jgi:hypothetical protein
LNTYVAPLSDCGDGALSEFLEPTITVRLKGVAVELPPTTT